MIFIGFSWPGLGRVAWCVVCHDPPDALGTHQANFLRKIWHKKGGSHGIKVKAVNPRVSLIMAIDNHGEVYASLT